MTELLIVSVLNLMHVHTGNKTNHENNEVLQRK